MKVLHLKTTQKLIIFENFIQFHILTKMKKKKTKKNNLYQLKFNFLFL